VDDETVIKVVKSIPQMQEAELDKGRSRRADFEVYGV